MPLQGKRRLLRELDDRTDRLPQKLAIAALHRLAQRTPRLTGHTAANWNIGVGAPDVSTVPEGDYAPSAAPSRESGKALGIRAGETVYITNVLPQVPGLEGGNARRAPGGFIKLTAAELGPLADKIIRDLRRAAE